MARGIVNQFVNYTTGMKLVAIANRTVENAVDVYHAANVTDVKTVGSAAELEDNIRNGQYSVTSDSRSPLSGRKY